MSWGEAIALTRTLAKDPTSWVYAAEGEWEHPVSREFLVLAEHFDAFAKVHFKNPDPYPRPFPVGGRTVEKFGAPIAPGDMAEVFRGFGRELPPGFPTGPPPAPTPPAPPRQAA